MRRKTFLKTMAAGAGLAAWHSLGRSEQNETAAPPNMILVFIDDMGWADPSCFGNTDAQTPCMDRMAAEGVAFEHFYVNSPICSPSRVAISTGTYPQRWNITSYLAHRKDNANRGLAQWLDPSAPMLARSLKRHGYATGQFGKWHMGGQRDVTDAPAITEYGFGQSLTNFEGLGPKLLPLTKEPDGTVGRIWEDAERLGEPVTWMQRSEITTGFIDAAIPFMNQARSEGRPFYVNLWPDDVHSPFWPPPDMWGDGSKRDRYLGVLRSMDQQLGKLFSYVRDDDELRDNTLILICSDNGHEPGAGRGDPFRGCKTNLYEGGIRSPLIAWGPGLMAKDAIGSRNKGTVFCAMDLVPSLLELAGADGEPGAHYDGENMLPVLLGTSKASRGAPIFFSRPPDRKNFYGFENLPDLAVRHRQWKLLCDYDGGRPELYDVVSDPGESRSLADERLDVVEDLIGKVTAWWRSMPSSEKKPA